MALLGMLFALTIAFSLIESLVTPFLGLPPGVKPGLANIVVMYSLFFLGARQALVLVVLKSFFVLITRGVLAGALSLAGGLSALVVMLVIRKLLKEKTYFVVSVSGAIAHNVGQLLLLNVILTQSIYTFFYLPVLLISGLIMGTVTAATLKTILPTLQKINFGTIEKKY